MSAADLSARPEDRLTRVQTQIARAAKAAGRPPQDVRLIAVSKMKAADEIQPLIDLGQRLFGENRVQEAMSKWPALKAVQGDIELHLIGPLQTNKVKEAVGLFDVIHTLDREKLARALVKERDKGAVLPRLLVQVNTGKESQKAGVVPDDVERFTGWCRDEMGLTVDGLMCIPPQGEVPQAHFQLLKDLAGRLGLAELSMGMSGDFETAVGLGATYVRVGTALFGPRAAANPD